MSAAKEVFAVYFNDTSLDSRQIYFVSQIEAEQVKHPHGTRACLISYASSAAG